jgi:hypothetical protein
MSTTLRSLAAFSLGALLAVPTAARAVNMTLEATKSDGGAVRVCVGLDSAGQKVAGTQNDLIWDGSCAALKPSSCTAVADSKKPLHGNTPPNAPNTYRALVFALDNVDPIRDGALYCCDFDMTANPECCAPPPRPRRDAETGDAAGVGPAAADLPQHRRRRAGRRRAAVVEQRGAGAEVRHAVALIGLIGARCSWPSYWRRASAVDQRAAVSDRRMAPG